MDSKKRIAHRANSHYLIIYSINRCLKKLEKLGYHQYQELFSIHRVKSLFILETEIESNKDTLIKFLNFLYQYNYTNFVENFDNHYYILADKDYIDNESWAYFISLYNCKYIVAIDNLEKHLTLILNNEKEKLFSLKEDDPLVLEAMDALDKGIITLKQANILSKLLNNPCYNDEYMSKINVTILETLNTISTYGDIATEFLLRVLKYDFIGYNGDQKYIVTSSLTPEKDFADLILQGYKVIKYSQLVYD